MQKNILFFFQLAMSKLFYVLHVLHSIYILKKSFNTREEMFSNGLYDNLSAKKQWTLYNLVGLSNVNDAFCQMILVSENHQTNIYDQG